MLQLHALSVCNHFVTNRNQVCFLGYDPFVHPQCDSCIEVQKWPVNCGPLVPHFAGTTTKLTAHFG
jgi:hypothetical protein